MSKPEYPPDGTTARLKKGHELYSLGRRLQKGEIFVLKYITREEAGQYWDNKPIWYCQKEGFVPRSGSWWKWSEHFNTHLEFDMIGNPFLDFCKDSTKG